MITVSRISNWMEGNGLNQAKLWKKLVRLLPILCRLGTPFNLAL
jgi:hypothetical protein